MSLPKFPGKFGYPPTFSAADLIRSSPTLKPFDRPLQVAITFQESVLRQFVRLGRGRKQPAPFGEFYILNGTGGTVGAAGNFGIGAPVAVFMLEWLAAAGAREFLAIGFAGGLAERQSAGDLVVCSRALRDEGTSHHYLPPADYAEPDLSLSSDLQTALNHLGYAHEVGPSWTTDAPLRETFAEIEQFAADGILTVEMEAAALFAAAEVLGLPCAAAFAVGDTPKNGRWQIDFDRRALRRGLDRLVEASLQTFAARS